MKKALVILGLLAMIATPAFADNLGCVDYVVYTADTYGVYMFKAPNADIPYIWRNMNVTHTGCFRVQKLTDFLYLEEPTTGRVWVIPNDKIIEVQVSP